MQSAAGSACGLTGASELVCDSFASNAADYDALHSDCPGVDMRNIQMKPPGCQFTPIQAYAYPNLNTEEFISEVPHLNTSTPV